MNIQHSNVKNAYLCLEAKFCGLISYHIINTAVKHVLTVDNSDP